MPFKRDCKRCGGEFQPTGKENKICKKCLRKSQLNAAKIRMKKYYTKQKLKGGNK